MLRIITYNRNPVTTPQLGLGLGSQGAARLHPHQPTPEEIGSHCTQAVAQSRPLLTLPELCLILLQ